MDLLSIRDEEARDESESFGSWVPAPITREGEYKSLSNYRKTRRAFPFWFKRYLFDFWDREVYTSLGPEAFLPLSFEEVLKAIPTSSLQASPGFPWVLAGYVTKQSVIDKHYAWLEKTYETVSPSIIYSICPKNELRPSEKASENKIRTFCIANIEHMILMEKYFGNFIQALGRIADKRFSMIGFSQYHGQWHSFVKKFTGYHTWAKDGSKFDFSVTSQFIEWFFEWFATHAKIADSEQYELLKFMTCIKVIVTVEGYFFTVMDSNPSGHLLTAVINTFFNNALNYFAFCSHCRPMTSDETFSFYHKICIERLLGDDAIEGVLDGYKQFWNFDIECSYLDGFLEYTTNSKPGNILNQDFLSLRTTVDPVSGEFVPFPFSTRWINSVVHSYTDLSPAEKLQKLNSLRNHSFYNHGAYSKLTAITQRFMNKNKKFLGTKEWDDAVRSFRSDEAIRALYHIKLE